MRRGVLAAGAAATAFLLCVPQGALAIDPLATQIPDVAAEATDLTDAVTGAVCGKTTQPVDPSAPWQTTSDTNCSVGTVASSRCHSEDYSFGSSNSHDETCTTDVAGTVSLECRRAYHGGVGSNGQQSSCVLTTPAGSQQLCSAHRDDYPFADYTNGCQAGPVSVVCVDHFDPAPDRAEETCTITVTGVLRCSLAHFYYPDQGLSIDNANTGCRRDT